MAWCPKCKSEYREGFTVCSDCKVPLVDTLEETEMVALCTFSDKKIAEKFIAYLEYSSLDHSTERNDEFITVLTDKDKFHEGVMAILAFTKVEENLYATKNIDSSYFVGSTSKISNEINDNTIDNADDNTTVEYIEKSSQELQFDDLINFESETGNFENEDNIDSGEYSEQSLRNFTPQNSVIYESNSTKADESYTTGIMLLIIGIMGVVAMPIINHGFSLTFSNIAIMVVFAAMIIYALFSFKASAVYSKAAVKEKETVDNIQDWLSKNITKADLVAQDLPTGTSEINYFRRVEYIKERLSGEFSELDDNFSDMLIDEFYESVFDE